MFSWWSFETCLSISISSSLSLFFCIYIYTHIYTHTHTYVSDEFGDATPTIGLAKREAPRRQIATMHAQTLQKSRTLRSVSVQTLKANTHQKTQTLTSNPIIRTTQSKACFRNCRIGQVQCDGARSLAATARDLEQLEVSGTYNINRYNLIYMCIYVSTTSCC